MNERIKTGGPAFPVFGVNCVRVEMDGSAEWEPQQMSDGMTLRDYFAAQSLPGLLAGPHNDTTQGFAALAYELADAMIAARVGEE